VTTGEPHDFDYWQRLGGEDPERLVDHFLKRYDLLSNESQKAFIAALPGRGELLQMARATSADPDQPLFRVPYILQDLFDSKGLPTRCGAPFGDPFEAPLETSCLLAETLDNAGALLLAKTVPAEFGWHLSGHNPTFGHCPHAHGPAYVCGGGASTCAYAVSDRWVPVAFGLDSCAGIRISVAFHGLFGFRMETNNYAREGVFPIIPSIESVGWITSNLDDLLRSFSVFYTAKSDHTEKNPAGYLYRDSLERLTTETKLGLMELTRALDIDEDLTVNKIISSSFHSAAKAFKTIESRELYSIHQYWIEEYGAYYEPKLREQIEAGVACTPEESEEAATVQQNLRATMIRFFRDYDYLILPISPLPRPRETEWNNRLEDELMQLNAPLSLAMLPALILPFQCRGSGCSAAQFVFNPGKLHLVPKLIEQLKGYYAKYTPSSNATSMNNL